MRHPLLAALLLAACGSDADGDGVKSGKDCDDADAARFPGNPEICDGIDNDCNDQIDDAATDAPRWYADADGDDYGDAAVSVVGCEQPSGYVGDDTDCDDTDEDVSPETPWYADGDGDGAGYPGSVRQSCTQPDGYVDKVSDCNDEDPTVYQGAPEVCDGVDNDCNGKIDEGMAGTQSCPAASCAAILSADSGSVDGPYWLDPAGTGAWQGICDMTTDGGGWVLVSWTGDSSIASTTEAGATVYSGLPYPGNVPCSTYDCLRGSAGNTTVAQSVFFFATELAVGHSAAPRSSFDVLASYDDVVSYRYEGLSALIIDPAAATACDPANVLVGTATVIQGDTATDGAETYISQWMHVSTDAGLSVCSEDQPYAWSPGTTTAGCDPAGAPPSSWLGNWATETGPLEAGTGARSFWVR